MWGFKSFSKKEKTGLEGRCLDVSNLKIQVQHVIAEGGFSSVYLARDVLHVSKHYALKHMICNDEESLELVTKEISVMKSLKGHPNVVTLYAHAILDMGRTKEAFLVMEYCEKSLVSVLENRGSGHFDEKQVISIFRDACNAVFAMHSHSPPIAHRDLKAENLLLGSDGLWKLCDFGSTTTNHKRFEKPEEMGIEEDNIRKHTTPAYRAPEMWDLFRRDLINEKVDIWALGCLLFRLCYFKNAFDGESKLQILNGNYRIPELPRYSSSLTNLIRDMLRESPDDRPDITQVWFRVNEQLPASSQKSLPDGLPESEKQSNSMQEGITKTTDKFPSMPHRSPPPPPSSSASASAAGGQLGAFWSTQHANSLSSEEKVRANVNEPSHGTSRLDRGTTDLHTPEKNSSPASRENVHTQGAHRTVQRKAHVVGDCVDHNTEWSNTAKMDSTSLFKDDAFNTFVAEFDGNKINAGVTNSRYEKEVALEAEIEHLKEQLKQANAEKAEITSKFEKLTAICRSQRQELQELKQALASKTPSSNYKSSPKVEAATTTQQDRSDWSTPNPEQKTWQAFADDPQPEKPSLSHSGPRSVRTRTPNEKQQASPATANFDSWGFETERFTASPAASTQNSGSGHKERSRNSSRTRETEISQPSGQPAGWAGF